MKKRNEEQLEIEEGWDIKKVLIGLFVIGLFVTGASYFFSPLFKGSDLQSVLGAREDLKEEREALVGAAKNDAEKVIEEVKKDIEELTPENISNSSEEIEKIVNNLNSLRNVKQGDPKDLVCKLVCNK